MSEEREESWQRPCLLHVLRKAFANWFGGIAIHARFKNFGSQRPIRARA